MLIIGIRDLREIQGVHLLHEVDDSREMLGNLVPQVAKRWLESCLATARVQSRTRRTLETACVKVSGPKSVR